MNGLDFVKDSVDDDLAGRRELDELVMGVVSILRSAGDAELAKIKVAAVQALGAHADDLVTADITVDVLVYDRCVVRVIRARSHEVVQIPGLRDREEGMREIVRETLGGVSDAGRAEVKVGAGEALVAYARNLCLAAIARDVAV